MSVCDVPLCPNMSMGGTQQAMGAPRGVPRVNRPASETRNRLRIRLHKREATLHAQNKLQKQNQPATCHANEKQKGTVYKSVETNDDGKRTVHMLPTKNEHDELADILKSMDTCTHRDCINPSPDKDEYIRKLEHTVLHDAMVSKLQKVCLPFIHDKDKENRGGGNEEVIGPAARGCDDIDTLIKFIEGKDYEIAQKKVAKKARQKQKKEEEKRKKEEEEEAKRKAERIRIMEERRLEELRLKAEMLAKQAALKKAAKKNRNHQQKHQTVTEAAKHKKNNKKNKTGSSEEIMEPESLEETIPAMVTIKRIIENNNCPPTVTITLKGSTPDQDKLLYTLVNGHNNPNNLKANNKTATADKKDNQKSNKKKKKGVPEQTESVTTNELKVTLSVDKSFRKELENNKISIKQQKKKPQSQPQQTIASKSDVSDRVKMKDNMIDIPSLKLPPGITITKVSGPVANRKTNNVHSSDYPSVPANKSGVIVVDTEKLIQQSVGTKKSKKKKKKGQAAPQRDPVSANTEPATHPEPATAPLINMNEQATISKGANGMVTIRRPRPVDVTNEAPISDYLSPVIQSKQSPNNKKTDISESKPVFAEKVKKPPSPKHLDCLSNGVRPDFDGNRLSAQNILWGLPGIQITRVNKNNTTVQDTDTSDQMADVSIIRTGGFNLDKDDWPYESVFTPKDILEDDLDADERELEAFKRFCQQSVPPKHKEKVAHLNVKDIVLMKKNDVTYS